MKKVNFSDFDNRSKNTISDEEAIANIKALIEKNSKMLAEGTHGPVNFSDATNLTREEFLAIAKQELSTIREVSREQSARIEKLKYDNEYADSCAYVEMQNRVAKTIADLCGTEPELVEKPQYVPPTEEEIKARVDYAEKQALQPLTQQNETMEERVDAVIRRMFGENNESKEQEFESKEEEIDAKIKLLFGTD